MKNGILVICAVAVLMLFRATFSDAQPAPGAPVDKPVQTTTDQSGRLEAAIKPYIEEARKTYPAVKARYLAGLPKGETFSVTAKLADDRGHFEVVFIQVAKISDGKIFGRIANEIMMVKGYKRGDEYILPETDLMDWTISKADGTEEGNAVGKFIEKYQSK
jgi:uncharacterized protein YegJ (DUF2314 family)